MFLSFLPSSSLIKRQHMHVDAYRGAHPFTFLFLSLVGLSVLTTPFLALFFIAADIHDPFFWFITDWSRSLSTRASTTRWRSLSGLRCLRGISLGDAEGKREEREEGRV